MDNSWKYLIFMFIVLVAMDTFTKGKVFRLYLIKADFIFH